MANNSKHMASIITTSAFITSKRNDNAVSISAVDFNSNNNVRKQYWEYMKI